jgi:hypothetical protein
MASTMEWTSYTNSHRGWPAVSGGGVEAFGGGVCSVEGTRCSSV